MPALPAKVKCWKCGVVFVVGEPDGRGPTGSAETTVCRESQCGRRFWHTGDALHKGHARTGVWPEDAHRFVEVLGKPEAA